MPDPVCGVQIRCVFFFFFKYAHQAPTLPNGRFRASFKISKKSQIGAKTSISKNFNFKKTSISKKLQFQKKNNFKKLPISKNFVRNFPPSSTRPVVKKIVHRRF
jgi:hypothetical protein